jgi:AcrR family transcriptional regulator
MPRVAKPKPDRLVLLDQALTCLAEQGPQATSIDVLTTTLAVSRRTFYEVLGPKADVVQQVYSYAMDLLTADVAPPRPAESLQAYLSRCWQHTAQAALAQPRVFAFWQYYRTSPPARAAATVALGPLTLVWEFVTPLLARPSQLPAGALPLPVLRRGLIAQWSAAVEVALEEPACGQSVLLRGRVLSRGFAGWWQGTGLPAMALPAATGAKPAMTTTTAALTLLAHALGVKPDLLEGASEPPA